MTAVYLMFATQLLKYNIYVGNNKVTLWLAGNYIPFTQVFGHLQIVFDLNETEVQVDEGVPFRCLVP